MKEALREVFQDKKLKILIIPIVLTLVMFIGATFAWFNFYSDVNANMAGHVVSWNINFDKEDELTNSYTVTIDKIAPGMDEFTSPLVISNSGEAIAKITYRINSIKVFGTEIKVGDTVDGDVLDPIKLKQYIESHYPFKFDYEVPVDIVRPGESKSFTVKLNWDYETYKKVADTDTFNDSQEYYVLDGDDYQLVSINETGFNAQKSSLYITNDAEDTKWGEDAYTFIAAHPTTPCIEMKLDVMASQYLE